MKRTGRPQSLAAVVAVAILAGFAGMPLEGAWQYTRWGMSEAQVIAASNGTAVPTTQEERRDKAAADDPSDFPTLKAPYRAGEFNFVAMFTFKKNKLARVTLHLEDPSRGSKLLGLLNLKYGKPTTDSSSASMTLTVWKRGGDQVAYVGVVGSLYSITYQPLLSADNSGL